MTTLRRKRRSPSPQYSYLPRRANNGRNTINNPNENILMPEDVTQKMLDNISTRSGNKIYNAVSGTTCHQCR